MMATGAKITTLAPWFGGSRFLASEVGKLLTGCKWVGIPFAGGMPEIAYIDAPSIVVSDLHRHVINLAQCLRDERIGPILYRQLRRAPFHPEVLSDAQEWLKVQEPPGRMPDREAAFRYFVAVWMGRSGKAGGVDEFNGGLPVRWNANGGDSNTRYRSAVRSICSWRRILAKVNLVVQDCFEFLDKIEDVKGHGIYSDAPFPGAGRKYKHNPGKTDKEEREWHARLARALAGFTLARVVVRFYDDPLIRELYPKSRWTWHHFTGRKQSNADAPEVLLTNGPSYVKREAPSLFQ